MYGSFVKLLFTFAIVTVLAGQVHAYEACINKSAKKYNIHPGVIKSIIAVESGGNRYAINIQGKPFVRNSYDYAYELLKLNEGKSMDVGLMQINSFWFKKLSIPQYYGLDECFNIDFGTWILANEVARHGYNAKAIARYHSPDSTRGQQYANKVLTQFIRLNNKS